MQRSPRSSSIPASSSQAASTQGRSSQGTLLLALTGAGLVGALLFFVLPRIGDGRAAGTRKTLAAEQAPAETAKPEPELVALVQPVGTEPDEAASAVVVAAVTTTSATPAAGLTAEEQKMQGPKLRYQKSTGKPETVDHRELRTPQRQQRQERRKGGGEATAQANGAQKAQGGKVKASSLDRSRLNNRAGNDRSGMGKGKPKNL